jgi:hypothetical protein
LISWIFSGWLLLLLIRFFVFRWTGGYGFLLLFGAVRFEMLSIMAIKIVEFVQRNDVASVQKNVVNFILQNWIFFDQFLHNFDDKQHRGILSFLKPSYKFLVQLNEFEDVFGNDWKMVFVDHVVCYFFYQFFNRAPAQPDQSPSL